MAVRRSKCKTAEGQFASIKEPRSPTTKKNKTKRRTIYCGGGGTRWQPKPSPPPTPVATFGLRPVSFQKSTRIWKVAGGISKIADGFYVNSQVASFGASCWIFPKSAKFLIILEIMIFSRNFFLEKSCLNIMLW
jgi:hypothetical protein